MYSSLDELISARGSKPGFFFIQIGANDGVTDDVIRPYILKYGWSGILVEPLADVYEKLKKNYRHQKGLTFINAAVTPEAGVVEFWRHPELPQCSGLGVRTRLQHRASMEKVLVRGVTMSSVMESRIGDVDLVQIDTEGFDDQVITGIPFERCRPRALRWEHKHLKMGLRQELEKKLGGLGYGFIWEAHDTVAYLKE